MGLEMMNCYSTGNFKLYSSTFCSNSYKYTPNTSFWLFQAVLGCFRVFQIVLVCFGLFGLFLGLFLLISVALNSVLPGDGELAPW